MLNIGTPAAPANILLIRLKSIGDVIFTLPAVHVVRENFPEAKLHFLVSKEHASLVRGFADVDEIISLNRAVFRKKGFSISCAETFQLLRQLRQKQFSHIIDFQGYAETEMLSWWSGAPQRWGNVYHPLRGWLYTQSSPRDRQNHPAEWNLSLLRKCGLKISSIRNQFVLPAESLVEAKSFFSANHLDPAKPTLYLQPFTSNLAKNWPLENYRLLARFWRGRGVQVIFGGGPADKPQLEIAREEGFVIAVGAPRMMDMGLMKLSTLIVGGDTGFLHLAVAMGKRVLMLLRRKIGAPVPFQHPDWIVEPALNLSMKEIEFEKVLHASATAFKENGVA